MSNVSNSLREHIHVTIVVTLLTLVMTFPTLVYVFRADVIWLPTGRSTDVFIKLWDVWYGQQFLTGQADRFHTRLMFYPHGVSLVHHPFFIPLAILLSALNLLLPRTNAFSLAHLLVIWFSAWAAYVFRLRLFKDQWIALFWAVVFGLCPHLLVHFNHPDIAFIATMPLIVYCFHRGLRQNHTLLEVTAVLLTGLSTIIILYQFVCQVITLELQFFPIAERLSPARSRHLSYAGQRLQLH